MTNAIQANNRPPTPTSRNRALVVALLALAGVSLLTDVGPVNERHALAAIHAVQPEPRIGIVNPDDQRLTIIQELRKLNTTISHIEKHLTSGDINVKVLELPANANLQGAQEDQR